MLEHLTQKITALARSVIPGAPAREARPVGRELDRGELGAAAGAGSNVRNYNGAEA